MNNSRLSLTILGMLLLASLLSVGQKPKPKPKSKVVVAATNLYLQEIKKDIQLPADQPQNIVKLIRQGNKITAIAKDNLFIFENNKLTQKPFQGNWQAATLDPVGKLWICSPEYLVNFDGSTRMNLPFSSATDTIFCILWDKQKSVHIGTNKGMYSWTGSLNLVKPTEGKSVKQIVEGADNDLWVATNDGLFTRKKDKWINLNDYVMAPGIGRNILSLSAGTVPGDVIFGTNTAVSQIAENGNHWTYTGEEGLPYGPVTTISHSENELWLGTPNGAILKNDKWHYYSGKRWLPDNKINDILIVDQNTVWIATPKGISEIKKVQMSLAQKAARFDKRLNERHLHHGLISDCVFKNPGDTTSFKCYTNDNDGLWSSIYLAAESFRFAVTGAKDAYENAVRTFKAMEMLEKVTPMKGFVARSYVSADEETGRGGEWHLSKDGKWKWKADTSSDEIVGHMFAYPIFYELAAQGEIKERAKNLVHRLMSNIVDNNFQLHDLDGIATRWAVWTPDSLNNSPNWWYEKGINSLQILSFLESAYFVTGDLKFDKAYQTLVKKYHYVENMVQQKMFTPFEINHSDDELSYLPYYCLLRYARDPLLKKSYQSSLKRSWSVEQPDRNPLWNIISSTGLKTDCDTKVAVDELQEYPMETIAWGVQNHHRWDLRINPIPDRFMKDQATRVIPIAERGITKWNTNPYQFDYGGNGTIEDDGAAFLLPYWMGRYHKLIKEQPIK